MKVMSPLAAAATVLLHVALIAALAGLAGNHEQTLPPSPLAVQIVPAAAPATAAPPVAPMPLPAAPPPKKKQKRPEARPAAAAKSSPPIRQPHASPVREPQAALEAKPSPPTAPSAAAATPEAAPPAARAAPSRTGASDAAYAASNRKPAYPRLSRSNNEQGTVVLRVLVKADGTAGPVEVKTSSGFPLLDKSASATVQTWRFAPATLNGKPVDEWYEVPIPFKLVDD